MTSQLEGVTSTTRLTGTTDELGGIGRGDDVIEVLVSSVSDVFNAWRLALGE
jgi:hypothetical protein